MSRYSLFDEQVNDNKCLGYFRLLLARNRACSLCHLRAYLDFTIVKYSKLLADKQAQLAAQLICRWYISRPRKGVEGEMLILKRYSRSLVYYVESDFFRFST